MKRFKGNSMMSVAEHRQALKDWRNMVQSSKAFVIAGLEEKRREEFKMRYYERRLIAIYRKRDANRAS